MRSGLARRARAWRWTARRRAEAAAVERAYRHAMEARFAGLREAEPLLRDVVAQDPSHAAARHSLGSLLMEQAKPLFAEGQYESSLPLLREAHSLRTEVKYARRLQRALVVVARAAAATGHASEAAGLIDEAVGVLPDERMVIFAEVLRRLGSLEDDLDPVVFDGLAATALGTGRLDRLVTLLRWLDRPVQLAGHLPPVARGRSTLVIVEAGVEELVLPRYLAQLPTGAVYSQHRLGGASGRLAAIPSLLDVGSVGTRADWDLCRTTDGLTEQSLRELREVLPPGLADWAGVDLLSHLDFELGDRAFGAGRLLAAVQHLLAVTDVGLVVFIVGDGRLHRACLRMLERPDGPDVRLVECSRVSGRLSDDARTPAEFRSRSAGTAGGLRERGRAELALVRRVWRARRSAGRLPQPGPAPAAGGVLRTDQAPVAVLTASHATHTGNVAPVLEHLLPEVPVVALVLPAGRRASALRPYEELAARHPQAFALDQRLASSSVAHTSWSEERRRERLLRTWLHRLERRGLPLGGADLLPLLEPALARLVRKGLPEARAFAQRMDDFLQEHRPRALVIAPDRFTKGRLAATLARRQGVPTLFPQAVFFSRSPRYKPLQTDVITVMDHWTRELYVEHFGTEESRVLVTGVPRFDVLHDRLAAPPEPDQVTRVAAILQRFSVQETTEMLSAVAEALRGRPDVELVVKVHPSEPDTKLDVYRRVVQEVAPGRPVVVTRDGDLHDLLQRSAVVVAVFSNVVVEAAVLGKPVVCLNTTGEDLPVPLTAEGAAVEVRSAAELAALLPELLDHGPALQEVRRRQEGFFARNPHLLSGPAAPRIAEVLLQLPSQSLVAAP